MSSVDVKKRLFDLLNGTLGTTGYYGVADLAANTNDLISEIYVDPTYTAADRAKIATRFTATPISVLAEFPRNNEPLPSVVILRSSDGERPGAAMGDYLGQDDDGLNDIYGTRFNEVLEIHVLASGKGSRMLRDMLYLAVRELVIRGRPYLMSGGADIPTWRGGKDGQFQQPEFAPHIVHGAYAQIGYSAEMSWAISKSTQPKAYEQNVTGINQGQVSASAYLSEE